MTLEEIGWGGTNGGCASGGADAGIYNGVGEGSAARLSTFAHAP